MTTAPTFDLGQRVRVVKLEEIFDFNGSLYPATELLGLVGKVVHIEPCGNQHLLDVEFDEPITIAGDVTDTISFWTSELEHV